MTHDFTGAACIGRWWLWDSDDIHDHREAAAACQTCPHLKPCRDIVNSMNHERSVAPEGTWAGRLYRRRPVGRPPYSRAEEAMFTLEDAQREHAAFNRGVRTDRSRMGERAYQRMVKRMNRGERAS